MAPAEWPLVYDHDLVARRLQRYTRWLRPAARAKAERLPPQERLFQARTAERRQCGSTSWPATDDTWDSLPIATVRVRQFPCADFARALTNQANRRDDGRREAPPRSVRIEREVRPLCQPHAPTREILRRPDGNEARALTP